MSAIDGQVSGKGKSIPKKEKPSGKFGFRKDSRAYFTSLPGHKTAAQLLALPRERHPVIQNRLSLAKGSRCH
jgi:hypothetical protein